MRNTFATYHPIIEFGFFCAVIGIGMFMIHPVFLAIGASAAFTYAVITGGKGSLKFTLCFLLPMILFIMVVNPLVNHQGMTVLFQLKYSYVTLEAVIYGLMMGLMLAAVLLWFSSYNKVMTSDKFTYLFGRIMPSISLVFTMVMRFIPNYQIQIKKIADARKAAGEPPQGKTKKDKINSGMKIISIRNVTDPFRVLLTVGDDVTHLFAGFCNRSFVHQKTQLNGQPIVVGWKINAVCNGNDADAFVPKAFKFQEP